MSLWIAANEIEELSYKLANVRAMIELVAEDVASPYSGALWAIRDVIDDLQNKVFTQSENIMGLHRAETKPKKAKK
jgi:hypothetical protein